MPDLSTKIEKNQLHILSNAKLTPHLYGKMIVYLTNGSIIMSMKINNTCINHTSAQDLCDLLTTRGTSITSRNAGTAKSTNII